MLQQTQVITVIPYYNRFLARFPTIADLARADEQEVLRLWQGLGYYSRARHLHQAARQIVDRHAGQIPSSADELLALPGIGRYTAGAIASIAFGVRSPILDGNVARVLCRLGRIESDPRDAATAKLLWQQAAEILPRTRVGDFNSALMELGATLCTPKSPQCPPCPLRPHCAAFAAGVQGRIPAARPANPTPLHRRWTFVVESDGKFLIEQRPAKGRWARMWQFPTVEAGSGNAKPNDAQRALGFAVTDLQPLTRISHALTHRRYQFRAYVCRAARPPGVSSRRWVSLQQLDGYPMPGPHVKIARLVAQASQPLAPTGGSISKA